MTGNTHRGKVTLVVGLAFEYLMPEGMNCEHLGKSQSWNKNSGIREKRTVSFRFQTQDTKLYPQAHSLDRGW